jgi:hypothetical protein
MTSTGIVFVPDVMKIILVVQKSEEGQTHTAWQSHKLGFFPFRKVIRLKIRAKLEG